MDSRGVTERVEKGDFMPTIPFEPLLNRDLRKMEAKEIIETVCPLLQEEINYATNAFQRCQESMKGMSPDEPLPILVSYHHIIGMTDGIEVLLSQSCVIPSIPLLRSSFEALLTMQYITKEDSKKRSFSWLVLNLHNRLKRYDLLDLSHVKGKEFKLALAKEGLDKSLNFELLDVTKAKNNLQSLLSNPNYSIAEEEYQRRKLKAHNVNWYSFYGGPPNLRELAKYLNRESEYDFLYRYWSDIIHVGALSHFLTRTNVGSPAFKAIRYNNELKQIGQVSSIFIIDATRLMIKKYCGGEEQGFTNWYITEIRDRFLKL